MSSPGHADLAHTLRMLVAESGLLPAEVARRSGISEATVSRYLNGRIRPSPDKVGVLVEALGLRDSDTAAGAIRLAEDLRSGAASRVVVLRSGTATSQRRYAEIDSAAEHVATFTCTLVPGLLQTERYARAVFTAGGQTGDVLEANLRDRLSVRQRRLADPALRVTQVITEGALIWHVDSLDLMVEQLDYLATLCRTGSEGRVRIGIIPSSQPTDLFPRTDFDVYDDHAVIVGTDFGTCFLDRPHDVAGYVERFRRLTDLAVFGDGAAADVERIAERFTAMTAADTT
ncbi:MAG: helix-turn-helix transcriptional regulator [Pseudonocardia sp.]|nr:helix-turn-helix transcriptional regulator [Pseudonocardia sp.]